MIVSEVHNCHVLNLVLTVLSLGNNSALLLSYCFVTHDVQKC